MGMAVSSDFSVFSAGAVWPTAADASRRNPRTIERHRLIRVIDTCFGCVGGSALNYSSGNKAMIAEF
jgi:hypothetical protein